tara:strand:- start:119 stop:331 length:213 start_codon:yes stop_codon:yes gene_type:complete
MYGWYSKTQQQTILERKKRENPYIYYIDNQDQIVLVTEVNKGNKINFDDAISLGELKKFYKVSSTPLKLD